MLCGLVETFHGHLAHCFRGFFFFFFFIVSSEL